MSQKLKDLLHKVENGGEIKKEILVKWIKEAIEDNSLEKYKTEAIIETVDFGVKNLIGFGKGIVSWYKDMSEEQKKKMVLRLGELERFNIQLGQNGQKQVCLDIRGEWVKFEDLEKLLK